MLGIVRTVASAWLLLRYHCFAHLINCNTQNCHNTIINCAPNAPCSVSCSATQSCSQSTINCPEHGDCNIYCGGEYSCQHTIINATRSVAGDFSLLCEQSTTLCTNMTIYGSTSNGNHGAFNVLCNGESNACSNSDINCGKSSNCLIACNAAASCQYSTIHSPDHKNLLAHCNGDHSCIGTVYDASKSLQLSVTGCSHDDSCSNVSLYCPPHTNGIKHCFITGNTAREWNIYAVNGWNDINNMNLYHKGTMFCGDDYNTSCHIASDEWSCAADDSNSNNCDLTAYTTTYHTTVDLNLDSSSLSTQQTLMRIVHSPFAQRILFGLLVISIVVMIGLCCFCRKPVYNKADKADKQEWERLASEPIPQVMESPTVTFVQCTERNVNAIADVGGYANNQMPMHSKQFNSMQVECQSLDDGTLDLNKFRLGTMTQDSEASVRNDSETYEYYNREAVEINRNRMNIRHVRKAPIMKPYSSPSVSLCILDRPHNEEKEDSRMIINTNTMHDSALSIVYSSEDEEEHYPQTALNDSLPSKSLVNPSNAVSLMRGAHGNAVYHKPAPTIDSIECRYAMARLQESETDVSSESLTESTDKLEATPTVRTATSVYVGTGSFGHSFDPAPGAC